MTGEKDLPTVDNVDNVMLVFSRLRAGADRLLAEHRSSAGVDRQASRARMTRFREETLAGLIAGPHIPMRSDKGEETVRTAARQIDAEIAAALREP
jgi:hypothetical protein